MKQSVITYAVPGIRSKDSNKYHFPTCKSAAQIKSGNMVEFASPEEAGKVKRTPCGNCNPPAPAKDEGKKDETKQSDEPKK